MAAGMATEYEAIVPDPRLSWAAPLSWEVTARALGGRRKALIRWGTLTNAISNPTFAIPSNKQSRGLGRLFSGRAPGANRLGNCAPRKIGQVDMESIHERLENIADNAGV